MPLVPHHFFQPAQQIVAAVLRTDGVDEIRQDRHRGVAARLQQPRQHAARNRCAAAARGWPQASKETPARPARVPARPSCKDGRAWSSRSCRPPVWPGVPGRPGLRGFPPATGSPSLHARARRMPCAGGRAKTSRRATSESRKKYLDSRDCVKRCFRALLAGAGCASSRGSCRSSPRSSQTSASAMARTSGRIRTSRTSSERGSANPHSRTSIVKLNREIIGPRVKSTSSSATRELFLREFHQMFRHPLGDVRLVRPGYTYVNISTCDSSSGQFGPTRSTSRRQSSESPTAQNQVDDVGHVVTMALADEESMPDELLCGCDLHRSGGKNARDGCAGSIHRQ